MVYDTFISMGGNLHGVILFGVYFMFLGLLGDMLYVCIWGCHGLSAQLLSLNWTAVNSIFTQGKRIVSIPWSYTRQSVLNTATQNAIFRKICVKRVREW